MYLDYFEEITEKVEKLKHIERINDYILGSFDRLNCLGYWESEIDLPRNFDILLRENGTIGYDLKNKKWVLGHYSSVRDDLNNPVSYYAHNLGTTDKKERELKLNEEVIVCDNTFTAHSDLYTIKRFAQFQADTDVSMIHQLINSRNVPFIVAKNNNVVNAIKQAFKKVKLGEPIVVLDSIVGETTKLDILDPNMIEKMQFLNSSHENILKRFLNTQGIKLDSKDKKAQVNNLEMMGYDDYTTLGADAHIIPRLEFCEKMKEKGIDISYTLREVLSDNEEITTDLDGTSKETSKESTEESTEEPTKEPTKEPMKEGAKNDIE